MPERPVRPSECCLALALPMSRAELLADIGAPCPSDFARGIGQLREHTGLDRTAYDYEEQMKVCRRVVAEAERHGVHVVRRAALSDLRELTGRFHVVSVVAHAPSHGVSPTDILEPATLVHTLLSGTQDDHARLREHLSSRGIALRAEAPPPVELLAEALDAALWTRDPSAERTPYQMDRTRMEDMLSPSLRPAPVLELSDGLHCLGPVREAISAGFDGVLDLSACTSVVLAEALKRTRNEFIVIGTRRPTIPLHRFMLYELRLREMVLAGRPVRFTQVNAFVAKALELAAAR